MRFGAPVSLRNRISLVLVGVVAVALVGANLAVYTLASRGLEQRVEEELDRIGGFMDGVALAIDNGFPLPEGDIPLPQPPPPPDGYVLPEGTTGEYVGIVQADGSRPLSLFLDDSLDGGIEREPPAIPVELAPLPGERIFVDSSGRTEGRREPYLMRITAQENGTLAVVALPTANMARDRRALVRLQLVAGLTVLVLLALLTRWLVGVGLRPLVQMEEAAERIADGDLTHRVEPSGPQTEISRLGAALNRMLAAIEQAFATKEASEQKLRRFVADASHEMRTPLTSIRGYAQLLRRDRIAGAEEQTGAAGRIEDQATRLSSLVEDMLLLARLDAEAPLRFTTVDLNLVVGQVVDDARVVDPDREVSFEAAGRAEVSGDADALTRMVTNLVANACQHTPPGTPVELVVGHSTAPRPPSTAGTTTNGANGIRTGRGAGEVVVDVVDHGPGIAPDARPHLFNRFYRADQSRSRARGGAGLGLAIVAGIVAAHRGSCEVRDTPGGGATFRIRLPAAPAPPGRSMGYPTEQAGRTR